MNEKRTLKYIKNFYRLLKNDNDTSDMIEKINETLSEEVYEYEDLIKNELQNVKNIENIIDYEPSIIQKIIKKLEEKNIVGTIFQKIVLIGFLSNYMKQKIKVTPKNITKKELEDIYNAFKIETGLDLEDHLNGIKKEDILNEIKDIYTYLYNQNENNFFLKKNKILQKIVRFLNQNEYFIKYKKERKKEIEKTLKEINEKNYDKENKSKYFMLLTVFTPDDVDEILMKIYKKSKNKIQNKDVLTFFEKYANYKLNGPREATEDYQDKISRLTTLINDTFWKEYHHLREEAEKETKKLIKKIKKTKKNEPLLVEDDPHIPF